MLKIFKEAIAAVPATFDVVEYSRKSTVKNPVADADKYRAVLIASYTLPEAIEQGEKEGEVSTAAEVFQSAIKEAFFAAAGEILLDYVMANPAATEIPETFLTFAAVVERMQTTATSQRLNSEQILGWYDSSKTHEDAVARYGNEEKGKKQQAALRSKYGSLASNNSGITKELAVKMIAYVNSEDASNAVCAAMLKRLEKLTKATDTADDL